MDSEKYQKTLTENEFNDLYENYRDMYITIANSYIHQLNISEDIVNESFIKLWEKREDIRTGNYESYMFKVVTNRCLDYMKLQKAKERNLEQMQDQSKALIDFEIASLEKCNPTELFKSEMLNLLRKSVGRMPEITRKVFIASRYEGLTYEKIAEKFGITVRKVTSEIQAALNFLRTDLHDYLPLVLVGLVLRFVLDDRFWGSL